MCFVTVLTCIGIRNEEKIGVTIPLYQTKPKLYQQYCWDNGWKAYANTGGAYKKLAQYDLRPNNDEFGYMVLWPTGSI